MELLEICVQRLLPSGHGKNLHIQPTNKEGNQSEIIIVLRDFNKDVY